MKKPIRQTSGSWCWSFKENKNKNDVEGKGRGSRSIYFNQLWRCRDIKYQHKHSWNVCRTFSIFFWRFNVNSITQCRSGVSQVQCQDGTGNLLEWTWTYLYLFAPTTLGKVSNTTGHFSRNILNDQKGTADCSGVSKQGRALSVFTILMFKF